jgi:methanesulfonate monooxygenase subunit alpha
MKNALAFYEPKQAWRGTIEPASPALYSDDRLFREEQKKVFSPCWVPACHDSEIRNVYDYHLFNHPAGRYVFVIRGRDRKVRSFYNLCPRHGTSLLPGPSGNARRIACGGLLEAGDHYCVDVTRVLEATRETRAAEGIELREVRTSVGYGGFVWVNLDRDGPSLKDSMGDAMRVLEPYLNRPLQVFLEERLTVNTNYRRWRETNGEFYLGHLYHSDRVRRMFQPAYCNLHYTVYPNGHGSIGSTQAEHVAPGLKRRFWPSLAPAAWILVDLFPGVTYSLRSSFLRVETVMPVKAGQAVVEVRGLTLKSDTAAQRTGRILSHSRIWGDLALNARGAVREIAGQGHGSRRGDHFPAKGESAIYPVGMEHFYAEWDRRMRRSAHGPYGPGETAALYASIRN